MRALCTADDCREVHFAKGFCEWHYGRSRAGDAAALLGPRPVTSCQVCGASLRRTDMTLCDEHRPTPAPPFANPMVCICEVPDANPKRDFGMCHSCFRKPLALMDPALFALPEAS